MLSASTVDTSLPLALLLLSQVALTACAAPGARGPGAYQLAPLPAPWRRVSIGSAGQSFHHPRGGVLSASARCEGVPDAPLEILMNHLLLGIEARREVARSVGTVAGRAALRVRTLARLDGVPVTLELLVLRKDGCVYDLQLVAGPQAFAARLPDFERFLRGFAVGAGR